jgi:hypothetical protein
MEDWEKVSLTSIVRLSLSKRATEVSSHEVSIPAISICGDYHKKRIIPRKSTAAAKKENAGDFHWQSVSNPTIKGAAV